jgi:hypothetical protein
MPQVPLIIEAEPDDPGCATVMVDGTVAGRPYRFIVDTGAVRTQLETDEYTSALATMPGESSPGMFGSHCDPIVTVTDVAVGPLRVTTLDVTRVSPIPQRPETCSAWTCCSDIAACSGCRLECWMSRRRRPTEAGVSCGWTAAVTSTWTYRGPARPRRPAGIPARASRS